MGRRMGHLAAAPHIDMPRKARGQKLMKGKPLTDAEFSKMLAAVVDVVGRQRAPIGDVYPQVCGSVGFG